MAGVVTVRDPELPSLLPASLTPDPDARRTRRSARDWLVDIIAFLLSAGWTALVTALLGTGQAPLGPVEDVPRLADGVLVADLAAGWLGTFALWLRRRWPVGLATALAITGLFSITAAVAATVALFTVAVHRRYQLALVFGGLYAATAVPFFAYRADPFGADDPYWVTVASSVVASALVVGWGMFVRARRQLVLSLRDRAHRAESEQRLRAEQARHLERERIAREMHDVLAHRISLVSMHAGALEFRAGGSPEEIARSAGVIREGAHQALEELREVIGVLRAKPGDDTRPQPTLADLPALVEESRAAGVRVRVDNRVPDLAAMPAGLGRTAYRIVQEGLTNARKHAAGTAVEVAIAGGPGSGLTAEVHNLRPVGAAAAPSPIPGTGTGLVGLAERVDLAGGRLEHGPAPDGGFRLAAWLPWPA